MRKLHVLLTCVVVTSLIFSGCAARKTVERMDPDTTIDLSGKWNDTDSRMVSEAMITASLNHPWVARHMSGSLGKRPVVIVGSMRNRSTEHIAVRTFVNDIEKALVNSGEVDIVASVVERGELRSEKEDQRVFATPETIKAMGRELGADYMMTGEINTILDQEKGEKVIFYQIDLTLTNIETNLKIWMDQHKIKKYVTRSRFSS